MGKGVKRGNYIPVGNIIGGYNGEEISRLKANGKLKRHPLDVIAAFCKKEGISYGEYQRREAFHLLPVDIILDARDARRSMYDK